MFRSCKSTWHGRMFMYVKFVVVGENVQAIRGGCRVNENISVGKVCCSKINLRCSVRGPNCAPF